MTLNVARAADRGPGGGPIQNILEHAKDLSLT